MWTKFDGEARKAVFLAQGETQRRGGRTVDTSDLLLALAQRENSRSAQILAQFGLSEAAIRGATPLRDSEAGEDMTFSANLQRVIDAAYRETLRSESVVITTAHLLLGIMAVPSCTGAKTLDSLGLTGEKRSAIVD